MGRLCRAEVLRESSRKIRQGLPFRGLEHPERTVGANRNGPRQGGRVYRVRVGMTRKREVERNLNKRIGFTSIEKFKLALLP